jgi:hypothetical protein
LEKFQTRKELKLKSKGLFSLNSLMYNIQFLRAYGSMKVKKLFEHYVLQKRSINKWVFIVCILWLARMLDMHAYTYKVLCMYAYGLVCTYVFSCYKKY